MEQTKLTPGEKVRRRSITLFHAVKTGRITKEAALKEIKDFLGENKYPENKSTYLEAIRRIGLLTDDEIRENKCRIRKGKKS